jgi:hypothetical protein
MNIARHLFLVALCAAGMARAADLPHPLVVYDDELKNGFENQSWAKTQLSVPVGNGKPIRVEGDAWSALALHHEPFSTAGYSKLSFTINGGGAGGQNLMVRTMAGGKIVETDYVIQPKAKTWAVVEVPLKDIGAADKTIDAILLQGQGSAYAPYYVTRIQLE